MKDSCLFQSPKTPILARIVWTDETHNLYLSFMESSFVDQLYINENRSNDLLGCLHIAIRNPTTKDLALGSNFLVSCQVWNRDSLVGLMDKAMKHFLIHPKSKFAVEGSAKRMLADA